MPSETDSESPKRATPTLASSIGLPSGINVSDSKIKQSNTVTITGAATGTYMIGVNGSVVSYTYATGNTTQTIRDALKTAINEKRNKI